MKPTKNRVFCPSCRHGRMLFETRQKAERFIRFNGDEILEESGRAPVRSYYCRLCCGWHVTSIESEATGRRLDRRDNFKVHRIDSKRDMAAAAASIREGRGLALSAQLDDVRTLLLACEFPSAGRLLKRTLSELYVAKRYYPEWEDGPAMLRRGWGFQRILKAASRSLRAGGGASEEKEYY